jgi:hypothetical protein
LWDLDLLGLTGLEFLIVGIADDNWLAGASNDYKQLVDARK